MKLDCYELRLDAGKNGEEAAGILTGLLSGLGVDLSRLAERTRSGRVELSVYLRSSKEARRIQSKVEGLKLQHVKTSIQRVEENSWKDRWKASIKPFRFVGDFDIVPVWQSEQYRKTRRIPVYLDTSMAFGTGLHETTRFLSEVIYRYRKRFKMFLDIGTGTGLLSILARHCGAQQVRAIDLSPESVRVARQNMKQNGFRFDELKQARFEDYHPGQPFDVVVANLTSHDLLLMGKRIVSMVKSGGRLGVSGISIEHLDSFRQGFRNYPLRCLRVMKGKSWAAVLYKKL